MKAWGVATGVMLLTAGCLTGLSSKPGSAIAELKDARGRRVGQATFTGLSDGVRIVMEVRGLPPGLKAVHIHERGRCDPPAFTSAGDHFNPGKTQHGLQNPAGPHAGDLPNIQIDEDGNGRLETMTPRVTLSSGPTSILDDDGSALVVHGAPDDFKTDPTGNSGARIACGVITRSDTISAGRGAPPRSAPSRGY
ncbi:MAG TPA: superoxide dismutase family protein [Methylomirabilota bacterium]|jgi:Cu-Zn family superoxide dismutase